jgi:hypothetical protein
VVEEGTVVGSDAPDFSLSVMDLLPGLRGYKQFLEELNKYTTVGKLRNLRYTPVQIQEYLEFREVVQRARQLLDAINQLQPFTTYLVEAQANFRKTTPGRSVPARCKNKLWIPFGALEKVERPLINRLPCVN